MPPPLASLPEPDFRLESPSTAGPPGPGFAPFSHPSTPTGMHALIGSRHRQLLDWLAAEWLPGGPAVCCLEGFPGVGKTEIANALISRSRETHPSVYVTFPDTQSDAVTDFLWDLAGEMDAPEIADALGDPARATRAVVRRLESPVLVVVDEFQRALQKNGEPVAGIAPLLERMGQAGGAPGRVLLLTNRMVARGRWVERLALRSLGRLDTDEGVALLAEMLRERGQEGEVPEERRADVVEWVGGNPRAIRTVVESLRYSPLEELIGLAPEIWQTEDRAVSSELVRQLEKRLLEQILPRLDPSAQTALRGLAVHRRSFKKEAIDAISPSPAAAADTRAVLVDHFLLDHRSGSYALTEVVREVVHHRLDDDPGVLKSAHSRAADYYLRHFQARQIVHPHRLGGKFIEARYHLVHAGREDDLWQVSARLSAELRSLYTSTSRVPTDPGERDERIVVLSALLETQGDKGLHYYLARLLRARGGAQDVPRALAQVRKAVGPRAPVHAWRLLVELEGQVEGGSAALAAFQRATAAVPPEQNGFSLYLTCAEALSHHGRSAEAIDLLREGIGRSTPEQHVSALYQSCAELLAREGRIPEAVDLLQEGIGRIRQEGNLCSLYQAYAELLAQDGRTSEAVDLLREGIGRIPPEHGVFALYQALSAILGHVGRGREAARAALEGLRALPANRSGDRYRLADVASQIALRLRDEETLRAIKESFDAGSLRAEITRVFELQLQEDWHGAATYARTLRGVAPTNLTLLVHEAFCWLAAGLPAQAAEALHRFPGGVRIEAWAANTWMLAMAEASRGELGLAREAVEAYLGRGLEPGEEVSREMLLRLWDESAGVPGPNASYIFPHLPPSITGLPHGVTRYPSGPPVLAPADASPPPAVSSGLRMLVIATEWTSGHGGLSTFNRALCTALARSGQTVYCVVGTATEEEKEEARALGVTLVPAPGTAGDTLDARITRKAQLPHAPDVVVGHGRVTGPAARAQVEDHYPHALRVHFIHTAPNHIEWFKAAPSEGEVAAKAEERTRREAELAEGAGLVVAVGPLLARWTETHVRFGRGAEVPIHRFDPGLPGVPPGRGTPPPESICLVLGRAEDDVLKGLDLAARAISRVGTRPRPRLVVRGAPVGSADDLRLHLTAALSNGVRAEVLHYTADAARIAEDLRKSSLVLMPSRSEGFGLVGLEAIAAGVPVLVSAESGLGQLLQERVPDLARDVVVDVLDVEKDDAARWAGEIEFVLRDREAAFGRARKLREALAPALDWTRETGTLVDVIRSLAAAATPRTAEPAPSHG